MRRGGMSSSLFRVYEPHELGDDDYPAVWHRGLAYWDGGEQWCWDHEVRPDIARLGGVKHLVRAQAGDRCVRCGHPYAGSGEWSPCDERCTHHGPLRYRFELEWPWQYADGQKGATANGGIAKGADVEARWRILTVHHLNGRKHDLRWWNLAALCQRCHLRVQTTVQMERVYPFEHSEWFKPYAAGWYAYAYLGEDLTPERVEARLDELLGLERAA